MSMKMNLKEKARNIKKNLAALFIALKKKETPWYAKCMIGVTIGYALSPIDFIPDFIPVLGYLDDVIILPIFILLCIKLIPKPIFYQSQIESENLWKDGKPKKWYYAIPIFCIWFILIVLLVKAIFY